MATLHHEVIHEHRDGPMRRHLGKHSLGMDVGG
jgi:hypothetical protein